MKALDGLDGYANLGLSHAELPNKQSASRSKFPVQKKAFIKFVNILVAMGNLYPTIVYS